LLTAEARASTRPGLQALANSKQSGSLTEVQLEVMKK
jgi:hypothetical protein